MYLLKTPHVHFIVAKYLVEFIVSLFQRVPKLESTTFIDITTCRISNEIRYIYS